MITLKGGGTIMQENEYWIIKCKGQNGSQAAFPSRVLGGSRSGMRSLPAIILLQSSDVTRCLLQSLPRGFCFWCFSHACLTNPSRLPYLDPLSYQKKSNYFSLCPLKFYWVSFSPCICTFCLLVWEHSSQNNNNMQWKACAQTSPHIWVIVLIWELEV